MKINNFGNFFLGQPETSLKFWLELNLVMYISVIYVQLILSGHSRYVDTGATESDEIGGLITNDRWFLLGWFSSFGPKLLGNHI